MNGLGKQFRKKSDPTSQKSRKHQIEIAACEQKTTSENVNFVQTPFSHSTLKLAKKFHTAKLLAFRSTFCFVVTEITTPIWLQISWKMCERILKKDIRVFFLIFSNFFMFIHYTLWYQKATYTYRFLKKQ